MKKFVLFAAAVLLLAACGKPAKESNKPSFTWETNTGFGQVEIKAEMHELITVSASEGIEGLKLTLTTLPVELIGLANELISISSNKASSAKAGIFDLIADSKVASNFSSMHISTPSGNSLSGSKQCVLDLGCLVNELTENSMDVLPNASKIVFEINVVDKAGNQLKKTASFNWTSAPEINSTVADMSQFTVKSGEVGNLVFNIVANGKIAGLTIAFGGENPDSQIINNVKERTTDKTAVVDLINDDKVSTAFGLPKSNALKDKTSAKLDLTGWLTQASYGITAGKQTVMQLGVVDALGKSKSYTVTLVSAQ